MSGQEVAYSNKRQKSYIVWGVFFISLIISIFYALYLAQNENVLFVKIVEYFLLEKEVVITGVFFIDLLLGYSKKLGLVWLFSSFQFTLPLALLLLGSIVFMYGFTVSCFVILYGIRGNVLGIILYGMQAVLVIKLGMMLCLNAQKASDYGIASRSKVESLGIVVVGLVTIILLDLIGVVNFDLIKQVVIGL